MELAVSSRDGKLLPEGQFWPTTHFVNKVLLVHIDIHSFTYYLWLLFSSIYGIEQLEQKP